MEGDLPNLGVCVIAFRRVRCEVKTARGFPRYRVGASWHGRRKGGGVECGLVKKELVDDARNPGTARDGGGAHAADDDAALDDARSHRRDRHASSIVHRLARAVSESTGCSSRIER